MSSRARPVRPSFNQARSTAGPEAGSGNLASAIGVEGVLLLLGAVGAFLLGGATSLGQGVAEALGGLANSASGWTAVTAVLVALTTRRAWTGALLGIASFALLNLGYSVVSTMRGHPDSFTGFWVIIGFVVGAPVGVCAFWVKKRYRARSALAAGVLAAIGLGEAIESTLHPSALTTWYLAVISIISIALLMVTAARLRTWQSLIIETASAIALALAYVAAFAVLTG